jgi:anti-sigma factor RsiW
MSRISCDQARALMDRVLGDEGAADAAALELHLAGCAACTDAWRAQAEVRAILGSREAAPVPAGFAVRLGRALDASTPWWMQFDFRWWTFRIAPVAAVLLLLVGGAAAFSASGTSAPQDSASVTTALWDSNATVSSDSLLLAVLSGSPDDAVARYEGTTR